MKHPLVKGHTSYASEGGNSSTLTRRQGMGPEDVGIKGSALNEVKNYNLNWKNTWTVKPNQTLTFGYNWVRNDLDLMVEVEDFLVWNTSNQGVYQSLYAEQSLRLGDFHLKTGLRGTHYSETDSFYLSPRIELQYEVDPNWKLKSS